jgi:hypothetical protein
MSFESPSFDFVGRVFRFGPQNRGPVPERGLHPLVSVSTAVRGDETGGITMEPIMCPFCGGTNLFQEDDYGLEMDFEYWTVHHWECLDCAQSFDKIEILPTTNTFDEINESTIH